MYKKDFCFIILCMLIISVSCNMEIKETTPVITDKGYISLSFAVDESLSAQNNPRTITPPEGTLDIVSYNVHFTNPSFASIELTSIPAGTDITQPFALEPGQWSVTVSAYNNANLAIGTGTCDIIIKSGIINTASVTIYNTAGETSVYFSIDISNYTLADPYISGTLIKRDVNGGVSQEHPLSFSLNDDKTVGICNTNVPAGYYELLFLLEDFNGYSYVPVADYHDTILLVSGLPVEMNFALAPGIPNGGASIVFTDKIDRPVGITLTGLRDEVIPGSTFILQAIPETPVDRFEWRLNNSIIDGENTDTLELNTNEIMPGMHIIEVIVQKGEILGSVKGIFTLNPVPLTISLSAPVTSYIEGEELTVTATTSLPAGSYEWWLNGSRLEGEHSGEITLADNLQAGTYTLEGKGRVGSVVRSSTLEFTIEPLILSLSTSTNTVLEGKEPVTIESTVNAVVDSYEWYIDNVLMPGENSATLNTGAQLTEGSHQISCKAARGGIVKTEKVTIEVLNSQLTLNISALDIFEGEHVTVTGTTSLPADNYEWRLNGTLQEGEHSGEITLADNLEAGTYTLEGKAWVKTVVMSNTIEFTIKPLILSLTIAPIPEGEESITVESTVNTAVDSYEWYIDDVLLPGETSATLTTGDQLPEETYQISCKVTRGGIIKTESVVVESFQVSFDISDLCLFEGESVNVAVVSSLTPETCHWYIDGTLLGGFNSDTLTWGNTLSPGAYTITVEVQIRDTVRSAALPFSVFELPAVPSPPTMATGSGTSMIINGDSNLKVCGYNRFGQVGDNSTTDRHYLVSVITTGNVVSVAAGEFHSLAVLADGTALAWGYNIDGRLGDGTTIDKHSPVPVSNLTNVISVAAGDFFSLALKSDGTVWTWGKNSSGSLGLGDYDDRYVPEQITSLTNIVYIVAGSRHSLALKADGTVWAWGSNTYGQLGIGSTVNKYSPVQVSDLTGVIAIAAGYGHSAALKADGTVWTWGDNSNGELGYGTTGGTHLFPVQVTAIDHITAVAAGDGFTLALRADGNIRAWGSDYLGTSSYTESSLPVRTDISTAIRSIATSYKHCMALGVNGSLWMWGFNYYGQLGNGFTNKVTTPAKILY